MKQLIIYGVGSYAKQMFKYNERYGLYDIIGFVDDNPNAGTEFCGKPVMNFTELVWGGYLSNSQLVIISSIGYTRCNTHREDSIKRIREAGFEVGNFISPNANCWEGSIKGKNVIVFDNVFVGVDCEIGDGVIISEGTTLSHDVKVGNWVFFSDEVTVGGFARIGDNSFVGLNSTIKSDTKIGKYNIIGCGTNVLHDTEDCCVTVGNPGRCKNKDTLNMQI